MISTSDFNNVLTAVSKLEDFFISMKDKGYVKEVLIARLCFGGMKLKDAVTTSTRDILRCRGESDLSAVLPGYNESDFCFTRLQKIVVFARPYILQVNTKNSLTGHDSKIPAFSSRKGGAITTRTAERCLAECAKQAEANVYLTHQYIQSIGKLARSSKELFAKSLLTQSLVHDDHIHLKNVQMVELAAAIRPYFKKRMKDQSDIEDGVQETLYRLEAARAKGQVKEDAEAQRYYAIGIAKHVYCEWRRSRRHLDTSNLSDFFWGALLQEKHSNYRTSYTDSRYIKNIIGVAMKALSPRDCEIIQLTYSHSPLSIREIANQLNISTTTVRLAKDRAMSSLLGALTSDSVATPERMYELIFH